MSTTPQGPGWWRASDGRWYPPQAQPGGTPGGPYGAPHGQQQGQPYGQSYGPAYAAKGPGHGPGSGPGGVPPLTPPPRKSAVPKVLLIVGALVLVLVVGGSLAMSWLFGRVTENVVGGECDLVATDVVNEAMDGTFDVIQLGGLTSIATPVLDSRVLADGTTCWGTETGDTPTPRLVRVAMLETGDAAARFQQEKTLARGVKEDRGGGLSVESQPYFNRDVDGVGDEAFCTTTDMTGASGVLVRRGDTLVYVSLTSGSFSPDLTPGADGSIESADDDAHCDLAQRIATEVG